MNEDPRTPIRRYFGSELKQPIDRCNKLLAMVPVLASFINTNHLINYIVDQVKELVNADHVHIRVIDWPKNELILKRPEKEKVSEDEIVLDYPEFSSIKIEQAIGGRIFRSRQPDKIPDIQEDKDFNRYLNDIKQKTQQFPHLKQLIRYIERFGPAIFSPLLLHRKAIGVLTAIRLREKEKTILPRPFTDDDEMILKHFADQAAMELRNAWLFESATWQPFSGIETADSFTVKKLCYDVIEEAKRRTGCTDARVRFVDWKGECLVPGTIVWPDPPIEADPVVCLRKIGIGPAGVIAEGKEKKYCWDDLQNEPKFKELLNHTRKCEKLYEQQLEALEILKKSNEKSECKVQETVEAIMHQILEKWPEAKEDLKKRLNILKQSENRQDFFESCDKQINITKRLLNAWREYLKYLGTLNSEVAVPILLQNRLLGILNVHHREKEWFTDSDEAIIRALACRVATVIIEHQLRVLNTIQEIEQRMTAGVVIDEMAELLATAIKNVAFLADRDKISPLLYICKLPTNPERIIDDPQNFGEKFASQQRKGASREEIELLLNVLIRNDGLGWDAINELAKAPKAPVFVVRENVEDPISGGSPTAQKYGVMTTACLPLAFDGIVYGLLYIHVKERHFFTELEREILNLFAIHAAIVLKNLKRRSEEKTYESQYGHKLIEECISTTPF